jgi:uncharacterized protein YoxC
MKNNKPFFLIIMILITTTLACSISGVSKQAKSIEETTQALRTEVAGIVTAGGSLIQTAQALETEHPGILETVNSITTQGAPMISTIQAVGTNNPGLVQTAQALVIQEIPTGEPPTDIPIFNRDQAVNYFGSSQYIFYISPTEYTQVLEFYKTQMPDNGWQYLESDSHEYANAAQLNYYKDNRISTINLSINPLNSTTVIVISIGT